MKILQYALALTASLVSLAYAGTDLDTYREIPMTTEKSLRVKISGSIETIFIKQGPADKVVTISRRTSNDADKQVLVDYSITNGIGYLEINLDEEEDKTERHNHNSPVANARVKDGETDDWYITFPATLPIDFDLEFGFGKADVDLSGLQITRLILQAGASKLSLRSYTKNPQLLEKVSIEAGLGKFSSDQLGNLNFKKLKFEGGIGSYRLDLSGALRNDAHVEAEVGMGSITMVLPSEIPARLMCDDHWFNSTNFPKFFNRGEGVYETKNYNKNKDFVTIKADCGVGSVSIAWK